MAYEAVLDKFLIDKMTTLVGWDCRIFLNRSRLQLTQVASLGTLFISVSEKL
jgi:hypothetical protein